MRSWIIIGVWLVASGCGRNFVEPAGEAKPAPLAVSPTTLTLVPNQVKVFEVSGGKPGYTVRSNLPSDGGCGVTDLDGGAFAYDACLPPTTQDVVRITDGEGSEVRLDVNFGPAFAPDVSALAPESGIGCTVKHLRVSGGLAPYFLEPAESGTVVGSCGDAGSGLSIVASTPTGIDYLVPPWSSDGANTYAVVIEDSIGHQAGAAARVGSRYPFELQVLEPPEARQILAASPGPWMRVTPGQSVQVRYTPAEAPVRFSMAFDGNSSDGSITADGLYTAGPNPDTIDHLRIETTDLAVPQVAEVYVLVGNPQISIPLDLGAALRTGDFNGDALDDLLLVSNDQAILGQVIFGGSVLPTLGVPFAIPSPDPSEGGGERVEPFAVDGDALTDLLVTRRPNGGGPTPSCSLAPDAVCATDGGDPNYNVIFCDLPGGGFGCAASRYAADGAYLGSVPCTQTPNGEVVCGSGPDVLTCAPREFGGFGCDKGCLRTGAGQWLCTPNWQCGPAGCAPGQSHQRCNGSSCGLFDLAADGSQNPRPCQQLDAGLYDCGGIACTDDGRGGYDCGPRGCFEHGGALVCNTAGCAAPTTEPAADCINLNGSTVCSRCDALGYDAMHSGARVLRAQPGGTFVDEGNLPWARGAVPAQLAPGTLLTPDGSQLSVSSAQGPLAYTRTLAATQFAPAPQNAQILELAAPKRADGSPWGVFEAMRVDLADGGPGMAVAGTVNLASVGYGPTPAADNIDHEQLLVPARFTPDGDETLIFLDRSANTLVLFRSDGTRTEQVVPGTGPGAQLIDLVPLPGLDAVAAAVAGSQDSPLGSRHLLLGLDNAGDLVVLPWSRFHLPDELASANDQGLAGGDFNGDKVQDVAVVENQRLTLYPGQIGGAYAQGEQYAGALPMTGLSVSSIDGGTFLSAAALDGTVHLFAVVDRSTDGGEVHSSLAFLPPVNPAAPVDELAAVIRGSQLWTVSGGALVVYPDFQAPSSGVTVALPDAGPGWVPVLGKALAPASDDAEAGWLLFEQVDGSRVEAIPLRAESDGSVQVGAPVSSPPVQGPGGFTATGNEIQFVARAGQAGGYQLWTLTAGGAVSHLDVASGAGLSPACNGDDAAAPVPGTSLVLFAASPAGDGGCERDQDALKLYVYDTAAGASSPVQGPPGRSRIGELVRGALPDGGPEILGVATNSPGFFGVLQAADGGWFFDPDLTANAPSISIVDLGGGRHAISQVSPPSLRVIHR